MEAVLKDVAPANCYPQASIASVVITGRMYAGAEVGALVVKFYEAGQLQQGCQGALQQAGIGSKQGVKEPPVLFSKPAHQSF